MVGFGLACAGVGLPAAYAAAGGAFYWPIALLGVAAGVAVIWSAFNVIQVDETAGISVLGISIGGAAQGPLPMIPGLTKVHRYPASPQVYSLGAPHQVTTGSGDFGGTSYGPVAVPMNVKISITYPRAGNSLRPWNQMPEFSQPHLLNADGTPVLDAAGNPTPNPRFVGYLSAIPGLAGLIPPEKLTEILRYFPSHTEEDILRSVLNQIVWDAVEAASAEWPWLRIKADRAGFERLVLSKIDATFTILTSDGSPLRHNGREVRIPIFYLFEDFSVAATMELTPELARILHTVEEARRKVDVANAGIGEAMHLQRTDEIRAEGEKVRKAAELEGKAEALKRQGLSGREIADVLKADASESYSHVEVRTDRDVVDAGKGLAAALGVGRRAGRSGGKKKRRGGSGNNGGGRGSKKPAGPPAGGSSGSSAAPTPPKGKGGSGNPTV